MKNYLLSLSLIALFIMSANELHAQETYWTTSKLTTTATGQAAIEINCSVSQNGEYYNDYYGVDALCQVYAPDGTTIFDQSGDYQRQTSYAYQLEIPITQPGEYSVESQYYLLMFADDDDEGYFDDPHGILDVGVISEYGINQEINVYGTEEDNEVAFDSFQFAEEDGTVSVGAPDIEITPETDSLDRGQSETFTANVLGVALGGSTAVTWSISPGGIGIGSASGNSFSYTAPSSIASNQSVTLRACSNYLPDVCATSTIAVLQETVTVDPPNPVIVLADGVSQVYWYASVENMPNNTALAWTATPGTITSTGATTATYTAPPAASVPFGASPTVVVIAKACDSTASPAAICGSNDLTLVEPVSITGGVPASVTAGTTTAITITGAGFGPNPTVTVNNSNGGAFSGITFTPTAVSNTQIQGSLFVPLNLTNTPASQPISLTVSATTNTLTTAATSGAINIVPVSYTYTIALQVPNPSLTYGYSTLITPVMTCKMASGATCSGTVFNPQTALASFSLTQNAAYGRLSSTTGSNQSPPMLTIAQLAGYPGPTVVVQACVTAPVFSPVCATTNISIPVTSITLNPPTLPAPLTGGKTQVFAASIQNEGTAAQLTWTLAASPSSAAAGTLSYATTPINVPPAPTSGTSSNTYTAPATITSAAAVTLTACMTANMSICAAPVAIQLAGFGITATNNNPSQTALSLGHSMSYTVSVAALDGFNGTVGLSVSGLPAGVTAQLSAPSITTSRSGSVTLTLSSAYSNATFIGNSTITILGTSGSMAIPTSFVLTTRPLQYAGRCGVPTTIARFYPNPLYPD